MQELEKKAEKLLVERIGMNVQSVGQRLLINALKERMRYRDLNDPVSYGLLLYRSHEEWQEFLELMVVPETWFFRNEASFAFLRDYIRQWQHQHPHHEMLHLLSLGCSTGEEPYSLAITLMEENLSPKRFCIDAVDISEKAIARAKEGFYTPNAFRGTDPSFQEKYFHAIDGVYKLTPEITDQVHFFCENILESGFLPQKKQYQIIFCRNLLIYFHRKAQLQLLDLLNQTLAPDGILIMGPTDTNLLRHHHWQQLKIPRAYTFQREKEKVEKKPTPKPVEVPESTPEECEIAQSLLEEAKILADEGDLEQAECRCSAYLEQCEPNGEAYFVLGVIQHAVGDLAEAENYLKKAVYLEPEHHQALVLLALLAEKNGDEARMHAYRKRVGRIQEKGNVEENNG